MDVNAGAARDPTYWYLFRKTLVELIEEHRLWIRFVAGDGSELSAEATAYTSAQRVTIVAERRPRTLSLPDDEIVSMGITLEPPDGYDDEPIAAQPVILACTPGARPPFRA